MHNTLTRSAVAALLTVGVFGALYCTPAHARSVSALINVNTPAQTMLPNINVTQREDLVMDLNNNLGVPLVFEVPDMGIARPLAPAESQSNFLDVASMPKPVVPYTIRDTCGNVISAGNIVITDFLAFEPLNLDLNTAYQAETKPQPVYYETPPAPSSGEYIRGYW